MLNVPRTTDTILMVRPYDFGFNEETGVDNEFQHQLPESGIEINRRANIEFQNMVDTLRAEGVTVLILEKPEKACIKTPDAIFPNNWFSTDGKIFLRQYSRGQIEIRHASDCNVRESIFRIYTGAAKKARTIIKKKSCFFHP